MATYARPLQRLSRQRGLSLIELMIASVIGLILLAGVVQIMTGTSSSHRDVTRAGQLLENGRHAMQLLAHELEHAGYYDQFDTPPVPANAPDACATSQSALINDMGIPVQGFDAQAAGFSRPTCIPAAAYRAGTDILVVRRAETTPTPAASLVANEYYLQARYDGYVLDRGDSATGFGLTNPMNANTLPVRKYRVDLYFISPCSTFTDGACQDAIPTLKRVELGTGPAFSDPVTLVEGIENLQLYFGVDSLPVGALDGAPDRIGGKLYVAEPGDVSTTAGLTAWANVVGAQLYLLARDVQPTVGYKDEKTYVLSPSDAATPHAVPGNDTPYKRQVFASQIRIINPSSRREI